MTTEKKLIIARYVQAILAVLLLALLLFGVLAGWFDLEYLPEWGTAFIGLLLGWLTFKRPTEMLAK